MASELRVNTLKDASGNNSVGMSYVANGSAKIWANWTQVSTQTVRDSLNVSSITDAGTGVTFPVSFTSAMANNDYAGSYYTMAASGEARSSWNNDYVGGFGDKTTSQFGTQSYAAALVDSGVNDVTIQGDLA